MGLLPGFDAVYQINKCSSIFLLLPILVVKNNFKNRLSKLNNIHTYIKNNFQMEYCVSYTSKNCKLVEPNVT